MMSGVFLADAELAFAQGHFEQTITKTSQTIAAFEQTGQRLFLPDVLLLKALALLALEPPDLDAAYAVLTEAHVIARATGWQRDLWRLLADVEEQCGKLKNR